MFKIVQDHNDEDHIIPAEFQEEWDKWTEDDTDHQYPEWAVFIPDWSWLTISAYVIERPE